MWNYLDIEKIMPRISIADTGYDINIPSQGPVTHRDLSLGIEATRQFFNTGESGAIPQIVDEIKDVQVSLADLPGFQGCFGLGYPFYVMTPDEAAPQSVGAINEHLAEAQSKLEESEKLVGSVWPCIGCQETRGLPDLKTECKPCTEVVFKPRDLFKALPDIDIVTVFTDTDTQTEEAVQQVLEDLHLIQSDNDIRGAFTRTLGAMQGNQESKLPVDAHIWGLEDVYDSCQRLIDHPSDTSNSISGRSLHARWEQHDICFWFDFIFSLTEVGTLSPDLESVVQQTRSSVARSLGEEAIVTLVETTFPRGRAILYDEHMAKTLRDKIKSWREM